MSYAEIIKDDRIPLTKHKIKEDFNHLGISAGDFLLVHTSLNKLGYIIGGAQTLIEALMEYITPKGLIVMPTHSADNSNPEKWMSPPVPKTWFQLLKENIPPYDKEITPTRGVGVVPEIFRQYKTVERSNHPQVSFAAYGDKKDDLLRNHPYDYELSDASPLGLMYQWNFKILMIGTDYDSCTAMHLAEYRARCRKEIIRESAVYVNGERQWITYKDLDIDSDDFNKIGTLYENEHDIHKKRIGYADSRLIDFKSLIDFSTNYLGK